MTTLRLPQYQPFGVGNYPAGPESWATLPRRLALTTAERADGFTPDDPYPGETANSLESEKADVHGVLVHGAMRDWREYSPTLGTATTNADALCGMHYAPGSAPIAWYHTYLVTSGSTAAGKGLFAVSPNGMTPFKKATASGNTLTYIDLMSGDAGTIFGLPDTTGIFVEYSTTNGPVAAALNVGGGNIFGMHYAVGFGYWFQTSTGLKSADTLAHLLAGTLSSHADADTGGIMTFMDAANNGSHENGAAASVMCIAGRNSISNVRVVYSSNAGVNWSVGHNFGDHEISLTYSAARGLFIVLVDDGSIWVSSDGATWSQASASTAVTPTRGAITRIGSFAACGPVIAKLWSLDTTTRTDPTGIAWSEDLGLTWHVRAISHFGQVRQIKAIDGRFWACDGASVFHSGRLEAETVTDM